MVPNLGNEQSASRQCIVAVYELEGYHSRISVPELIFLEVPVNLSACPRRLLDASYIILKGLNVSDCRGFGQAEEEEVDVI